MKNWNARKTSLTERLADGSRYASGKTVEAVDLSNVLQAVIRPGDRVCLEGDNQKQADVLAAALANVDPAKINDLHVVQSGVVLPWRNCVKVVVFILARKGGRATSVKGQPAGHRDRLADNVQLDRGLDIDRSYFKPPYASGPIELFDPGFRQQFSLAPSNPNRCAARIISISARKISSSRWDVGRPLRPAAPAAAGK
jgi:Malonate decarboxylase, alpha subunit, transporter